MGIGFGPDFCLDMTETAVRAGIVLVTCAPCLVDVLTLQGSRCLEACTESHLQKRVGSIAVGMIMLGDVQRELYF